MKPVAPAKPLPNTGLLPNTFEHPAGRVGLSTDVQGADPKNLEKFNQSLPKSKAAPSKPVARKLPWEEDIMAARDQVAVDAEQWQVAQAEVTGAAGGGGAAAGAAEAGAAAGGAGAGGAGAGAAGAAGGAAGAAGAVAGISPLAFAPALALGGGGSFVNTAPTLKLPAEARLPINAGTGPVACAKAVGSDVDAFQTLSYYFLDGNGKRVSELPAMSSGEAGGLPVQVGTYTIDRVTGQISFTANGTDAHICDSDVLTVVVFDGAAQSAPQSITIERSLVVDNEYVLGAEITSGATDYFFGKTQDDTLPFNEDYEEFTQFRELTVSTEPDAKDVNLLDITSLFGWKESLVGDGDGWQVEDTELKEFSAYREGNELHIELEHCAQIEGGDANRYGYQVHVAGQFADAGQGVEFIHFEKGTTFAGYDLGQSLLDDDTYVPCDAAPDAGPSFFQEHGVYRVSSAAATANGDALNGTNCKDLIVGSKLFSEEINGGGGNDLLFAKSYTQRVLLDHHDDRCDEEGDVDSHYQHVLVGADTVRGGAGDDLIVLQGKGHTVVLEADLSTNGVDTIVGFDEDSVLMVGENLLSLDSLSEGFVLQSVEDGLSNLLYNDVLIARFVDPSLYHQATMPV